MVMPRKLTDSQVEKIYQLWGEGYTREELAERFHVSSSCIGYYVTKKNRGINEKTSVSYLIRKYQLLVGEEYDKARTFYHLKESEKYLRSMLRKVGKRFPEYVEDFNYRADLCSKILLDCNKEMKQILEMDWKNIEKECKDKWREYEKECRKKTGKSSMDRLSRHKGV